MRIGRLISILTMTVALTLPLAAQTPRGATPPAGARGGGRGGGGGRGAMTTMSLITTAWTDGGQIPPMYTQAGNEISPTIQWSGAPAGTQSFVLIFHDIDSPVGDGMDDTLHWLVWNIPGSTNQLAQGHLNGTDIPEGAQQISVSGPRYRGPGAPAAGPVHHYVMELYALDTMLQVDPAPQAQGSPNPGVATRASVMKAMAGHIRGKAAYVGVFRR